MNVTNVVIVGVIIRGASSIIIGGGFLLGLSKIHVYAIVDKWGDILRVDKEAVCKEDQYAVPMTMTLGHTWVEGVKAWIANL